MESQNNQSMLGSYVSHIFENPEGKPLFEKIVKYWLQVLEHRESSALMANFKGYWFLFDVISKSMVIGINKNTNEKE